MIVTRPAVAAVLLAAVAVAVPAPAFAAPTCFGKKATIVGGENDEVYGTNRADVIVAGTGESKVYGRGGNDRICLGGNGYKQAYGGRGRDRIDAGKGYDFKTLRGGPGDDFFIDRPGGQDTAWFYGGKGDDEIRAGAGPTDEWTENDYLNGGPGDDVLLQGAGRSLIRGGRGDDLMSGGRGVDAVAFDDSPNPVRVKLARQRARGDGEDTVLRFEHLVGSPFDDALNGSRRRETIEGEGGDDVIRGWGGRDTLVGGSGADELLGQDAADSLAGGPDDDRLDGGPGGDTADYYYFSDSAVSVDLAAGTSAGDREGADALIAIEDVAARAEGSVLAGDDGDNRFMVAWNIRMDGRAGSDTIVYITGTDAITVDLEIDGDSRGNVITDVENVRRLAGDDLIAYGDDGPNRITGATGYDDIDGRGGDDVLEGKRGTDSLDGGAGHDVLDGGPHEGRRGDECVDGEETRDCER